MGEYLSLRLWYWVMEWKVVSYGEWSLKISISVPSSGYPFEDGCCR